MSDETDRIETALSKLEELDEGASFTEKKETLEAFGQTAVELPVGDRELVLGEAQTILSWMQAPARTLKKYVDQASDGTGQGDQGESGAGQALNLPDPAPAEQPVEGAELLEELENAFTRYLALPDFVPTALALWGTFSHAFQEFAVAPILAITSPTHRCGKSTLLHVLAALVSRPALSSSITAAAIYRVVEKARPTLLIDEADSFMDRGDRHRNVLNSGHLKTGHVILCTGDEHEVRRFSTFSPKAIGLIGDLPPTLRDRSVSVPMRRRAPGEPVEQLRVGEIRDEFQELRAKVARWVQDHREELDTSEIEAPDELNDRAADNWRPLIAIADVVGDLWRRRAESAARTLSGGEAGREKQAGIALLEDIHTVFSDLEVDRIPTETLLHELADLGGRPWGTWSNGEGITDIGLARLLRPFGIRPKDYHFSDKHAEVVDSDERNELPKTLRGYEWQDFEESFVRYRIIEPDNLQEAQEAV